MHVPIVAYVLAKLYDTTQGIYKRQKSRNRCEFCCDLRHRLAQRENDVNLPVGHLEEVVVS